MMNMKDPAERAEWVYGQPMAPCPKCGSYDMKPQIPIALGTAGVETMPKLVAGDVAPHDLKELAAYLRNLNGADISVADQPKTVAELMAIAELPFEEDKYIADLEERKAQDKAALESKMNQQDQLDQKDTGNG